MPTIKGPITIKVNGEIDKKIKDIFKEKGISLPFKANKFTFKNKELEGLIRNG